MNNVISKELLSEVLGVKVWKVLDENMGTVRYCIYPNKGDEPSDYMFPINIYELAHMCKEWASEEGYTLLEFGKCVYLIPDDFDDDELCFGDYNCFSEKTEPKTIFKACQWILNNKEQIC